MNEPSLGKCLEAVVHATDEERARIYEWLASGGASGGLGGAQGGKSDVEVSKSELGELVAKLTADTTDNADGQGGGTGAKAGAKRCPFCLFTSVGFCVLSRLFPGAAAAAHGPGSQSNPNVESGEAGGCLGGLRRAMALEFGDILERIDQKIAAMARNHCQLQQEVAELRRAEAQGWFKFALRVEAEDFRAFAVIMVLGNRKAAARALEVPARSFYDRVERWALRGREYQRMHRLVEWRKKVGRKLLVPLAESVQSGEPSDQAENPVTVEAVVQRIAAAESRDYPAILREVFEALARQNASNWAAVREEVMDLIREDIG